jgi:hypothetical protein
MSRLPLFLAPSHHDRSPIPGLILREEEADEDEDEEEDDDDEEDSDGDDEEEGDGYSE